jgi:trimeric autotransporter adhesin
MLAHRRAIENASRFSRDKAYSRRSRWRHAIGDLDVLENRQLLATFTVSNLNDSGIGSFRQAIIDSNTLPGPDAIAFGLGGTIQVGKTSLPAITDPLKIDGSSAPGFAGSPLVTIDFQDTQGLQIGSGADGSIVRSLSLVDAAQAGITLSASHATIEANYVGLQGDGRTIEGNGGDGIQINASSHDNLIGHSDPVTSVSYFDSSGVSKQPVTYWQGIRAADTAGQYLISGTSGNNGLLYVGGIDGKGPGFFVDYPGAATTSAYGPDNLNGDVIRVVGSYNNPDATAMVHVNGFLYEGTIAQLSTSSSYRTVNHPGATFNFVHSTMGGLAVGNYDQPTSGGLPVGPGRAYIYDVASSTFRTDIVFPGSISNTAYGIWSNGGTSYTICGGTAEIATNNFDNQDRPIGKGYLVDYDSATGEFTHWKSYDYPTGLIGATFLTHFEGISSVEKGVYTLNADSFQTGSNGIQAASWVSVRRNPDGTFGDGTWVDLKPPVVGVPSSNSVYGNQVVGVVFGSQTSAPFQSTINTDFQLSNVISGNGGNGIGLYGSIDNHIAMNFIGTDVTGTMPLGNAKNGILATKGAARNLIGGQATGGNDPTAGTFVRPPQGNLISGNRQNGVLINDRAAQTLLSGNFVGTTASGNSALGNKLDGVAIENANDNQLIGCTFQQSPFVFYNVLSGNGGNGLRITNSNRTTVQANFMGAGANNSTVVANGGDGLLVSGTSRNTQVGGVIPLGNVISGNNRHGIEVRDRASGLTSFNTFAGVFAFLGAAPNRLNGISITSTGGNNLIRTCIVSGNLGNGIEIGGNATGVQVTETSIGIAVAQTPPVLVIPNGGSGIRISGNAHGNAIGGFQPSIEPQVTIAANRRYGIEIVDSAHHNVVFHTYIGTNFEASDNLGNVLSGIYLGPGTSSNEIGGLNPALQNKVLYSGGDGITIRSSSRNRILGNLVENNVAAGIGLFGGRNNFVGSPTGGNIISANGKQGVLAKGDVRGSRVRGNQITSNAGDGVSLENARNVTIGGFASSEGNRITGNRGFGVFAFGRCNGSLVARNTIAGNANGNVNLSNSRGITFIP